MVGLARHLHLAAARVFLLMFCLGLDCPCQSSGVIIGVDFAVLFTAELADCLLGTGSFAAIVCADIATLDALAVFPLVGFLCHNDRTTAGIFLLVLGLGFERPFFASGVIAGINFAVLFAADFALGLFGTSGFATLVRADVTALGTLTV